MAFITFQLIPLPWDVVSLLSPATASVLDYSATNRDFTALTIDVGATIQALQKNTSYVVLFFLVLVLVRTRTRLVVLAGTIVGVGFLEALFGTASLVGWVEFSVLSGTTDTGEATGTFANRNHYSAHLAMGIAAACGLLIASFGQFRLGKDWRQTMYSYLDWLMSWRTLLLIPLVVMSSAMLLSTSRAGVLGFFMASVLVLLFSYIVRGSSVADLHIVPFGVIAVAAGVAWFGAESLIRRVAHFSLASEERLEQWRLTWKMIQDYPITGSGAGTYEHIFPLYREGTLRPLIYDHAHNDYLELLSGYGIVGSLLLAAAVVSILFVVMRAYRRRHDPLIRGMLFASLAGSGSMLFFGIVDYNFHIPANAAYFFVLLGIGIAAARLPHSKKREMRPPEVAD